MEKDLYISLIFTGLGIGALIVALVVMFLWVYMVRNKNLSGRITDVEDEVKRFNTIAEDMHQFFREHFRVVDETIMDTRKERDEYRKRALEAEKKITK